MTEIHVAHLSKDYIAHHQASRQHRGVNPPHVERAGGGMDVARVLAPAREAGSAMIAAREYSLHGLAALGAISKQSRVAMLALRAARRVQMIALGA